MHIFEWIYSPSGVFRKGTSPGFFVLTQDKTRGASVLKGFRDSVVDSLVSAVSTSADQRGSLCSRGRDRAGAGSCR